MNRMLIGLMVVLFCATAAYPAPPQTINYQGMLKSAGGPVNGAISMTFKLYSSETDTLTPALWIESHPTVTVSGGKYSVVLGSVTPINLSFDVPYFLGVTVATDEEMTPRQVMSTAPYAFRAMQTDNLSSSLSLTLDARYLNAAVPKATTEQIATLQWSTVSSGSGTYSVGRSPRALVFDGTSVWVASYEDNIVQKINPSTGTIGNPIAVGYRPTALAFDGTSVWVANNGDKTVQKINPITGSVGSPITVGTGPRALAFDGTSIWVANYGDNTVQKIDPSIGTAGGPIIVGTGPIALAFDGTDIWVGNNGSYSIQKINPSTGAVDNPIILGTMKPLALACDGTSIWVGVETGAANDLVHKVDPVTREIGSPINGFAGPGALAFDGTRMWVANYSDRSVQKIHPVTKEIVGGIAVGVGPNALAVDGTNIWVANSVDSTVQKLTNVSMPVGVQSVGSEQITSGAVSNAQIADGAVTDAKITGPISAAKLDLSGVVNKAGDTMTGALNLPLNGLAIGTNQLVVSGGNVGIGTATPQDQLELTGNLRLAPASVIRLGASTLIHTTNTFQTYGLGNNNFFVGPGAGNQTTYGDGDNTAIGMTAMTNNTTGAYNTAMGVNALLNNTQGYNNTAIGYEAFRQSFNSTHDNTAVGHRALSSSPTITPQSIWSNTAVGSMALFLNQGGLNTSVGANSMYYNATGSNNTAMGESVMYHNDTGAYNTAMGKWALISQTSGYRKRRAGIQCRRDSNDRIEQYIYRNKRDWHCR